MRLRILGYLIASVCVGLAHSAAHAIDSVSVDYAAGRHVQMARLGVQSEWSSRWFQSRGYHIGGYWDFSVAQWRGTRYRNTSEQTQNLTSVGITPVFRWQQDNKKGMYIEGGIGAHLMSELYNNENKAFSTRFQFGDHLGLGYVFKNKLDVGLSFQHFSNANIKKPNPGINLYLVRARYAF